MITPQNSHEPVDRVIRCYEQYNKHDIISSIREKKTELTLVILSLVTQIPPNVLESASDALELICPIEERSASKGGRENTHLQFWLTRDMIAN
jgi:hypothetical protein